MSNKFVRETHERLDFVLIITIFTILTKFLEIP